MAFSGSSSYLKHAIVSYCNEAKVNILNVCPTVIEQHSEVSLQCVAQMAIGAARLVSDSRVDSNTTYSADYAIATSGMAGPTGTEQIPVGTVVIAVLAHNKVYSQKIAISSSRSRNYIRDLTVAVALDMLRRAILGKDPIAQYGYIKATEQNVLEIE